jgi:hypothetical protein
MYSHRECDSEEHRGGWHCHGDASPGAGARRFGPFGLPVGHPDDTDEQNKVLTMAFSLLERPSGPVLEDYPDVGEAEWGSPLQASSVESPDAGGDLATEVTLMRRYWESWVESRGQTAVGLCGVPPARFRGVIRYLERYLDDATEPVPAGVSAQHSAVFIRHAVDDLKAMYLEGRMVMAPGETSDSRQRWLWADTALGAHLQRVATAMASSTDPHTKATAYGIAR